MAYKQIDIQRCSVDDLLKAIFDARDNGFGEATSDEIYTFCKESKERLLKERNQIDVALDLFNPNVV